MIMTCGFCGNRYNEGETTLFRSETDDGLFICAECVDACNDALEEAMAMNRPSPFIDEMDTIRPSVMKKHFDDYIINQDSAKKKIAVAVYNHYKRCFYNEKISTKKDDIKLKKSNLLMVGPSGSGKTLFVETIAKKIGVPYAIQDSTSLTQSGLIA